MQSTLKYICLKNDNMMDEKETTKYIGGASTGLFILAIGSMILSFAIGFFQGFHDKSTCKAK